MLETTGPVLLTIFSPTDIFVVIIIGLLLFGGKKIPELAKGLGEGIKHFKNAVKDEKDEDKKP